MRPTRDESAALQNLIGRMVAASWVLANDGERAGWDKEGLRIVDFLSERKASIRGNRPGNQAVEWADLRLLMSAGLEECQRVLDASEKAGS